FISSRVDEKHIVEVDLQIAQILHTKQRSSGSYEWKSKGGWRRSFSNQRGQRIQCHDRPTLDFDLLLPKHSVKNGALKLLELGDGFSALGMQRVGLVQDRRDAALLWDRRKRNLQGSQLIERYSLDC